MVWPWKGNKCWCSSVDMLSTNPLGTKFSGITVKIQNVLFQKVCLKLLPAKCHPFCSDLNMLNEEVMFCFISFFATETVQGVSTLLQGKSCGAYTVNIKPVEDLVMHESKHDDFIKWKQFLCYWPFVRELTSHLWIPFAKVICTWTNGWVNNQDTGDLRCHHAHHNVTVMICRNTVYLAASSMMTSSNGNIFRFAGPLWGEFTGHRWIPLTKASDAELWCFLWSPPE